MTVLKELCVVQETYTARDGQEKAGANRVEGREDLGLRGADLRCETHDPSDRADRQDDDERDDDARENAGDERRRGVEQHFDEVGVDCRVRRRFLRRDHGIPGSAADCASSLVTNGQDCQVIRMPAVDVGCLRLMPAVDVGCRGGGAGFARALSLGS